MRFDPVECGKRMKALRESKNLTQKLLTDAEFSELEFPPD